MKGLARMLLVICIVAMGFCGWRIYKEFDKYWTAYNKVETIRKEVGREKKTVDFRKLRSRNKDIVAWLYCPGTVIDYPVVKGWDNKKYLHTALDGSSVWAGTLFVDYRTERPFLDLNTIIYGHHMRDGSMFHDLDKWKEKKYRKKHSRFYIYTPGQNYVMTVQKVLTVRSDDRLYDVPYLSQDKQVFLDRVEGNEGNGQFVTLSTCAYSFEDARTLVIGNVEETKKEIREIEIRKEEKTKWEIFKMMITELLV